MMARRKWWLMDMHTIYLSADGRRALEQQLVVDHP